VHEATVLFVDLVGSTALYQSLGNARAAGLVTGMTDWISRLCVAAGGQVLRCLGDGVLVAFGPGAAAFDCAILLNQRQSERNNGVPDAQQIRIKMGVARGLIVQSGIGWVGEAINVATELSNRSGPDQILATDIAVHQLKLGSFARFRNLGPMHVMGKSAPIDIFMVEWSNDTSGGAATVRGGLSGPAMIDCLVVGGIRLSWVDQHASFLRADLPIVLGRNAESHFAISDQRVSRQHARIYELDDALVLEDISRYGTTVRFASGQAVLTLRNQECVLHDECDIAFGSYMAQGEVPQLRLSFFSYCFGPVKFKQRIEPDGPGSSS
jgi:class 3 adenylate cyclase